MFFLDPEQFKAILDRFEYFAAILPQLHEAVCRKYPDGSYERLAFEKLANVVPKLECIRRRIIEERGSVTLTEEERSTIKEILSTFQNAKAVLGEIDFDISLPPKPL